MVLSNSSRLSIFTWHIHGSYLYYLSLGNYDIYIPIQDKRTEGYYGRGETFPFGPNVIEIPVAEIQQMNFDCILFQSTNNFLVDQYEVLSAKQRQLPKIYVEHNTPTSSPVDSRHIMDDASVIMVHVTHFNKLMWHNTTPIIKVIEHGVTMPKDQYTGSIEKGIVVINHIEQRGRITGWDIFSQANNSVPLDLVGMGTKESGGLGEVLHPQLPSFISKYRFFFNPIRYTSFGLAVCEAMMAGMPIVALATTEYVTIIKDGENGFIDTNVERLIKKMKLLIDNHSLAKQMGDQARTTAIEKFGIRRFVSEWESMFHLAIEYNNQFIYEKEDSVY